MKIKLPDLFNHFRNFVCNLFLRQVAAKFIFTTFALASAFICYSQNTTCPNADFEQGNLNNWVGKTGSCCPINTPTTGIVAGRHTIMTGAGTDPNACNAITVVAPGGSYSARLGNSNNGAQAEKMLYTFPVTISNPLFIYKYAVILQDPHHSQADQPRFGVRVLNSNGVVIDPTCGQYNVVSGPGVPGFFDCNGGTVHYRPWTTVGLNLTAYIGQNITIEFSTGDCALGGHYGYAYIDCYCSPLTIDVSYCNGNSATLTAPIGFTYLWSPGGQTTQTKTILNPVNGSTYSCQLTSVTGCVVTLTTVLHSTKPTAAFTANTNCINNVIFTDASTTPFGSTLNSWTWNFGDGNTSILQNPTHSYTSAGTYNVKLIVKNIQGCSDTVTVPVTVSAISLSIAPTSVTAAPSIICGGTSTLTEIGGFLGTGASYKWYTVSCGGTPAGTGTSITVSPAVTTTYYVRAEGTCNTTTCATVTVTVVAAPFAIATPASRTICCGGSTSIALSSFTPGTTFAWTVVQNGTTGASSGSGPTIAQILCTSGTVAGTATYSVTPSANGCSGLPITVIITVNPTPVATATPPAQTICSGTTTNIVLTGNVTGTTFSWTVVQAGGVTGASNGSGATIAQLLTTGPAQGTAVYTITPTANNCPGTPITVTITVNSKPIATATPQTQTICSGGVTSIVLTSTLPGTTFAWTVVQAGGVTGGSNSNGNSISQTLTTGTTAGTAVYTITPTAATCVGNAITVTITVNPKDNTAFTYSSSTFCQSGIDPFATITGLPGGTFSSTPAGLVILNTSTGLIDVSASAVGTYAVTYTSNGICPDTRTVNLTITAASPPPGFNYPGTPYCQYAANPSPVFNPGASAGTFSATPAGLVFVSANTGVINLLTSTPGTYIVKNVIAGSGGCASDSATTIVTISPTPIATASPLPQTICSGTSTSIALTSTLPGTTYAWTVVQTNVTGASAGNGSTIAQTLTSAIGGIAVYTITPTVGLCSGAPVIDTVFVNPIPNVIATPPSQTFCSGGTTSIALSGNITGTIFSWTVGQSGVTGAALGLGNAISQTLTATGTTAGTAIYTITPSANGCSGTPINVTVTVNVKDNSSFTYPSATYCQSGTDPTPTITGLPGGTFSSTPSGLSLNPSTGTIILSTSALGSYTLCYKTIGTCPDSTCITMTIANSTPTATFSYSGSPFCQNGVDPSPIFSPGASAGSFSAAPAGLVFVNVNTGKIDLSASAAGTYIVTNTIPPSGLCAAATATTTVVITSSDNASFTYTSATYCISGPPQTPTITGLPGGTFHAIPAGLSIDSITGTITLSTSLLGSYTLSYTTHGPCPNTSSITMTIDSVTPAATFSYVGGPFCQSGNDPSPLFGLGASAGIFSATPVGLVFVHVNTGQIDLSASATGTYTVTNTIPASGSCAAVSSTTSVTINSTDDASFVYSSATYCQTGSNPTPVITGLPGGVFSSSPFGLSLNPATGAINLSTSALGSYTLSYTTNGACPKTNSITMSIHASTNFAGFSYSNATYCQNGTNPFPVFVPGATAGVFTTNPIGLAFVSINTGEIDLANSSPGTYTVTNTIPASGGCAPVVNTTIVTITVSDNASFVYTSATYCTSGNPQTPIITGLPGGIFSSVPSGLSINPATGTVTLSTSNVGVYTLSYTTNGACPGTSSITMTITNTTPFANINYPGSPFCQNINNPSPVFGPGASAGFFTSSPIGLVFVHVNTGQIDLSASVPGTYIVTNTIPASGTCGAVSASDTISISPSDNASFVYSSATYCQTGPDPTPTITGLPGGTFSSIPPGLSINPATGKLDLDSCSLGAYTLTYTTNGPCPNTSSIVMTINASNNAAIFSYPGSPYCQNGTDPYPTFGAGASVGVFTASPVGLVFVHVNTGQIDLSACSPGTYIVTNTIPASGGCAPVVATATVTITVADIASFVYTSATYCTTGTPQTPAITGLPGGTFSSIPAGLSINPATGTITLSACNVGTYTVSYTTNGGCPSTSSIVMTITNTTPFANFNYPGSPFCQNINDPSPVFGPGASAGIFSVSPGGLVFIHVNTGQIDLSACTPGTYIVTNTIPASGTCGAVTATGTVIIGPSDDASFVYSSATYCQSGPNPSPSVTGLPGGTFSSIPPGLSINPATGTINLATSAVGAYTLSYTTNGPCANTSSIVMTINLSSSSGTFSYPGSPFCPNGANPYPTFSPGSSAGIFTASPAGLVFVHVNTGQINLSMSSPGTYTITNTIPASGGCAAVVSTSIITINVPANSTFTYSSATYCTSGSPQSPLSIATPGGTFSSVPLGLSVNPTTGTITLSTSNVGVYTLYYSTTGTCPDTSSITMTITNTTPFANINYSGSPFCQFGTNPYPNFGTGASAGTFTATPAGLVFIHVNTGQINLSLSAPGTYIVTNTIPVSGTCGAVSATTTVVIGGAPTAIATPSPQNICSGGTTSINLTSSTPGTTYVWTVVPTIVTGTSAGSGSTIAQTLSGVGSAVYTITPTAGGCIGLPITVAVTVNSLPTADTTAVIITPAKCGSATGGISGVTVISGLAPFSYQWKDSLGNVVGTFENLSNVGKGKYTLTVTDSNGCSSIIAIGPFTVTATPSVVAAFTANPITGETPLTVNFTNNSSTEATIFLWQFGTGDTSSAVNPTYIYQPTGDFSVCLIADNGMGCSDTVCDSINIYINSAFIVPNVFTPNGDNMNDIFTLKAVGLKTLDAEIYNRWGEKEYVWHTVSGGWDGRTASGIPATDGTYYYIINATGIDGKKYFEKGAFSLIRNK